MSFYDDASLVFLPSGEAGKDGKAYSMKPVEELGSELVTNGGFDTDSDWVKGTGWTISGGTANCDGTQTSTTSLHNTTGNGLVDGKKYRVVYTISGYAGGSIRIKLGNTGYGVYHSANGTYIQDLVAAVTTFPTAQFNADANFVGSIDNVSVKEITTSGDFTFSRGSNLTATRVDSNGLIEKGRENLLLQSNQFDTTWTSVSASVTGEQTGYDGSSDAWLLESDSDGASRRVRQTTTASGISTFSVYAKAGSVDHIVLYAFGANSGRFFDLNPSTIGSRIGSTLVSTPIDSKIEDVGGGWFRCSIVVNWNASDAWIYPIAADGTTITTAGDNIYIQDAQLEIGLVATEPILSGATTGKAGLLEDSPRFDYSGGASCPSLLLEPSRTQLIPQSEYFNFSGYTTFNSTINDNATTSPEGLINAAEIAGDGTTSSVFLRENISLPSVGNYTFSLFAKYKDNSDATNIMLDISSFGNGNGTCFFDIENGVKGTESGVTGNIEDYGSGWYRCSITTNITDGADLFGRLQFYAANSSESLSFSPNNANADLYIYGFQLEQASYPTSYIPNHSGGSVTRTADSFQNDTNTSPLNRSAEGTWFVELQKLGDDTNQALYLAPMTSNTQQIRLHFDISNARFRDARNGYATIGGSVNVKTSITKMALSIDTTSGIAKVYVNGSQLGSDYTLQANPFEFSRIVAEGKGFILKQSLFFSTALSDAECITLTS